MKEKISSRELKTALTLEREGCDFYLRLAEKTRNLLAQRLFLSLAGEEIQHMVRIQEIYTALREGKEEESYIPKRGKNLEKEIREFFEKLGAETLRKNVDNISGLKTAIKLEMKSYQLYQRMAHRLSQSPTKQFFEALMKEENNHFVALENTYRYLTDSPHWYAAEESKVWNWMST